MKLGAMNNPGLPVLDEVDRIGRMGFDFVDLTLEGPLALDPDPVALREILDRHGLFIVGHTDPALPWAYPLKDVQKACFDELTRFAEIFSRLGARVMNIHPCYSSPPKMRRDLLELNARALPPLVDMAQGKGLTLALENFMGPFNTAAAFRFLMDRAPGLSLHLDSGHTNLGGDSGPAFLEALGDRLVHVHFSDNRGTADHHMPLGMGTISWENEVRALKKAGYDETITLEIFYSDLEAGARYLDTSREMVKALWERD